jgi:hypothetical protein
MTVRWGTGHFSGRGIGSVGFLLASAACTSWPRQPDLALVRGFRHRLALPWPGFW